MLAQFEQTSICPDLRSHWQLIKVKNCDRYLLCSLDRPVRWSFSIAEGYALRYFTGHFTIGQVQQFCERRLESISPDFVINLIENLIECRILFLFNSEVRSSSQIQLKSVVQWFRQSNDFWILRNPEDVTRQVQVSDRHKQAIELLNHLTPSQIVQKGHITSNELRTLLQQLAMAGMLVGIEPPKLPKRKLTRLQLLFFLLLLLGNPNRWLSQNV